MVFLGDLLHSAHAHAPATLQALAQWRKQHAALELLLVRGNHDDHAGDPPAALGMQAVDEPLRLGGLALCHHPQPRDGAYVLAGHLHPCVVLGGRAHERLRLPCFHFGEARRRAAGLRRLHRHACAAAAARRARLRGRRRGGAAVAAAYTGGMNATALDSLITRAEALLARLETVLPQALSAPDWTASVAFRYRKRGASGRIEPVRHVATIRLDELVEVEPQKQRLLRNTEQFVAGHGANNVLLTGARGTGKSSLIKACLNEFAPQGLRLIEVDKADLVDLPDIVELVAERPERFIVYCDDLSFDEGEPGYKALKSILDGSVSQASDNVLIYATSNRRHLLPEYMSENLTYKHTEDGEVHPGEVVEEKISLSERFGLWVSFYPFTQAEYLAIVAQWLRFFDVDEAGHRRGAPGKPGLGAGARFALRPRGLPVCQGLFRKAPRLSGRARAGRRRRRRADRRRRPLPADQPARRQGLRRLLGVPRRQARSRRDGRAGAAARAARGAGHHHRRGAAVEDRTGRLRTRARAPALLQGLRLAGRFRDARAPGDGLADAAGAGAAGAAGHHPGAAMVCRRAGLCRRDPRGLIATLPRWSWLDEVKWDAQGLLPVIAQEVGSNDVLMFAFMNREALARTADTGQAVYWSRSRQRLWHKGEESGHFQQVHEMRLDCDNDVLLLKVTQLGHEPGIACHTGRHSCFFQRYENGAWHSVEPVLVDPEHIYK